MASMTAIGFALAASAAMASDSDELKKASLEGKWANDCAKLASNANVHATWTATAEGKVVLTTDTDKKDDNPSTLAAFKVMPQNQVLYTVKYDDAEVDVILKVEKARYRMWSSSSALATAGAAAEEFYVKDGKSVADGKETQWYNKCAK
jgi:hypothetical protein